MASSFSAGATTAAAASHRSATPPVDEEDLPVYGPQLPSVFFCLFFVLRVALIVFE